MAWARIDSGFATHPKLLQLTPNQRWIHVSALCWAAGHGTGGFVPAYALPALGGNARAAARLVDVGLWEEAEDGWQIHDWHVYNVDAETSKATRDEGLVRRAKWREQKREQRRKAKDSTDNGADMSADTERTCPAESLQDVHGLLDQTRPDPPSSDEEGVGVRGTSSSSAGPTPPSPNGNGITPLTGEQRAEAQALIDRMRAGLATSHQDDPERRRRVERFRAEAQERAIGGAA